jgi:hypothetical protein
VAVGLNRIVLVAGRFGADASIEDLEQLSNQSQLVASTAPETIEHLMEILTRVCDVDANENFRIYAAGWNLEEIWGAALGKYPKTAFCLICFP